ARLIDFMAEDGIVGNYNGSQAREVLITLDQWASMLGQEAEPAPPAPKRNRIMPNLESGNAPFDGADDGEMSETDDAVPAPPRRRAAIQLARYDDDEDEEQLEVDDTADEDSDDEHSDDALDEESDEDADAYDSAGEVIDDTETDHEIDYESDDD